MTKLFLNYDEIDCFEKEWFSVNIFDSYNTEQNIYIYIYDI